MPLMAALTARARITVSSPSGKSDMLSLVENTDYTSGFDNGYDVVKMMNTDSLAINLYAEVEGNYVSTLATNDLTNTQLIFDGNGVDESYTFTFSNVTGTLTLYDIYNNISTTLTEGGTYIFSSLYLEDIGNRFCINYQPSYYISLGINENQEMEWYPMTLNASDGLWIYQGVYLGYDVCVNTMPLSNELMGCYGEYNWSHDASFNPQENDTLLFRYNPSDHSMQVELVGRPYDDYGVQPDSITAQVTITIQSPDGATDVLHLVEGTAYTSGFDQGFDIQKAATPMEDSSVVNIYALMADGTQLSTLATDDLSNTEIVAVSSPLYADWTLTFTDVVGTITLHNVAGSVNDRVTIIEGTTLYYQDLPDHAISWSFVINSTDTAGTECEPFDSTVYVTITSDQLPYVWQGREFTKGGMYGVTYVKLDGCDSTLNLVLTVQDDEETTSILLTPGVWDSDGARFAAYYWNEVEGETDRTQWSDFFFETQDSTLYATNIPVWAEKIIFVRLNPMAGIPSWEYRWDQTDDLVIDYNTRHYIITDWDQGHWESACPTEVIETEAVICEGDSYYWEESGQSYSQAGVYDYTVTPEGECEILYRLNLTVHAPAYIEEIVSVREDRLPYNWRGYVLTEAGVYYDTLRYTATACDSICYTLRLTVTELPIYRVNVLADHGHVNGTGTYPEGTQITLTAVPDEGFAFQMWSDGTTTNPKNFTVMRDTTFRALFYMPEVEQEVTIDSIETNSVTITWDTVPGATLYELRIYKNGELVVTYQIDADNNILNETFHGPDRLIARRDSTGGSSETLQVEVSGLESGQDYTYSLDAMDDDRSYVGAQSGSFTTEAEEPEGLEDVDADGRKADGAAPRKLLRDGRLYIVLPDGTTYDSRGACVE